MRNKKYRSFLITPAFVEARRRKIQHDASYGRVLPPGEREQTDLAFEGDGPSKQLEISQKAQSRRESRNLQTISRSVSDIVLKTDGKESVSGSRMKSAPLGSHFQSWKIPERVISADVVKARQSLDIEATTRRSGEKKANSNREPDSGRKRDLERHIEHIERENTLPKIKQQQKPTALVNGDGVLKEDFLDLAKQWTQKSDKKDKMTAEMLLTTLSNRDCNDVSKPKEINLRNVASKRESISSAGSELSFKSLGSNCIHRTSSVAWRRDSTWLKPTKSFHQTWHGLPTYPIRGDALNVSSIYMRPHRKTDHCFSIHPEWGLKV